MFIHLSYSLLIGSQALTGISWTAPPVGFSVGCCLRMPFRLDLSKDRSVTQVPLDVCSSKWNETCTVHYFRPRQSYTASSLDASSNPKCLIPTPPTSSNFIFNDLRELILGITASGKNRASGLFALSFGYHSLSATQALRNTMKAHCFPGRTLSLLLSLGGLCCLWIIIYCKKMKAKNSALLGMG